MQTTAHSQNVFFFLERVVLRQQSEGGRSRERLREERETSGDVRTRNDGLGSELMELLGKGTREREGGHLE